MPIVPIRQEGFNSGILSKKLLGKISLEQYSNGLYEGNNVLCLRHGPASTRPGFQFIYEVGDSTVYQRLISFSQSTTSNILIEVGVGYFRFYTFDGTSVGLITGATGAYELANTLTEDQIKEMQWVQSGDVVYIAHKDFHPKKLTRVANDNWVLEDIGFLDGPYMDMNTESTYKLAPSATTGTGVTLTASGTGFTPFTSDWVGRHIRIQNHATATQWGWCIVTAVTDSTHATIDIVEDFAATTASQYWRLGEWSDATGYPGSVTIHQQRLCFGGWEGYPQKVVGSRLFSYTDFSPSQPDGTVSDAESFSYDLSTERINDIIWMRSHGVSLILGMDGGEFSLYPSGSTLSPLDIASKRESSYGSIVGAPVLAGSSIVFAERLKRRIRAITYDYVTDTYRGPELTILADDLTEAGIEEVVYQQQPQSIIWVRLSDGSMIGLTYDEDQKVYAWHSHTTGGSGAITSLTILPSAEYNQDMLFAIVERTINSQTVKYIEMLTRFLDDSLDREDYIFLDSALVYDGAEVSILTGLSHLEGATVRVTTENAVVGDYEVSLGQVNLVNQTVQKAVVGLPYDHDITLLPFKLDKGTGVDLALARISLTDLALLTRNTTGLSIEKIGSGAVQTIWARQFDDYMDSAPSDYDEIIHNKVAGRWDSFSKLKVSGTTGIPFMIVSIITGIEVNDF